jgi:hypothetical protein
MSIIKCDFELNSADFAARMMMSAYSRDSRRRRAFSRIYLSRVIVIIATFDRSLNRFNKYRFQISMLFFILRSSFSSSDISVVYHVMIDSRKHVYKLLRTVSISFAIAKFLTLSMNKCTSLKYVFFSTCCIDSTVIKILSS